MLEKIEFDRAHGGLSRYGVGIFLVAEKKNRDEGRPCFRECGGHLSMTLNPVPLEGFDVVKRYFGYKRKGLAI